VTLGPHGYPCSPNGGPVPLIVPGPGTVQVTEHLCGPGTRLRGRGPAGGRLAHGALPSEGGSDRDRETATDFLAARRA